MGMFEYLSWQCAHEIENAGVFPLMLAEGLIIHKQIDDIARAICGIDPLCIAVCGERPFTPLLIRESECDIIREFVILEHESHIFCGFWSIQEIGRAPS